MLMKRFAVLLGILAVSGLAAGCTTAGYYDSGYYYTGMNYDPDCDYYTPPWGYPSDYCHYRVWNEPVYYAGVWFDGPIYYRTYAGANWFWLNGNWRRDEWRGPRPRIAFNDGRNQFWRGDIHRAQEERQRRGGDRSAPPRMGDRSRAPASDNRGDGRPGNRFDR